MSFLNSMLPLDKPIVGIEYQMGELLSEMEVLRLSVVDVRCTDTDGRQLLVEMQMHWSESFNSRGRKEAAMIIARSLLKMGISPKGAMQSRG